MSRFRKRPKIIYPVAEVEAHRLTVSMTISTENGKLIGNPGDWLVVDKNKTVHSENRACQRFMSNRDFIREYMLMSDDQSAQNVWDIATAEAIDKQESCHKDD